MIEFFANGDKPAIVNQTTRTRLGNLIEHSHEETVDISGEVLEADIRQGRFQVWIDDRTGVSVSFTPEQENIVTQALRDHRTLRIQVIGKGDISPQGKPLRIKQVQKLQIQTIGKVPYDDFASPIEDVLEELARKVPEEEWKKLPSDLTDNLDNYLYGKPKK